MKSAALFLFLAAAPQALLTDGVYQVPAGDWRYVEPFLLKQMPVAVDCSFQVTSGGPGISLELVDRRELGHILLAQPHESVAATAFASSGELRTPMRTPGEYAILIRAGKDVKGPASVHLRLSLDFSDSTGVPATYLTPRRRWTVVAISFAAFFAIVIVSGRKLLHAMRRG